MAGIFNKNAVIGAQAFANTAAWEIELPGTIGSIDDGADVAVVRVQTAVKDYEQAVQDKSRCEEDHRRAESALRQAQAVSLKVKEAIRQQLPLTRGKLQRVRTLMSSSLTQQADSTISTT